MESYTLNTHYVIQLVFRHQYPGIIILIIFIILLAVVITRLFKVNMVMKTGIVHMYCPTKPECVWQ